jgi:deoxyribonuclease-4
VKFVGAHVSAQGGVDQAPLNAAAIGATAFGLFVKNQKQWHARPLEPRVREAFAANMEQGGFSAAQVLPHAGYLINLANPNPDAWTRSTDSFINEMRRCADLGLDRLNIHPGSHLRQCSVEEAVANVARASNQALAEVEGVTIVFESTAGQGGSLGANFEELAAIIGLIDDQARVGICLDTAHMFAAGFDLIGEEAYQATLARFDELIGFGFLRGMHLNDTKIELGRRVDRHAPLGEGLLGWDLFRRIMNDPRLDGIPLILETPDETRWAEEIRQLYALAAGD